MEFIDITENKKNEYNAVVTHPLQSYEWGEFRKKTGVTVIRKGHSEKGKLTEGFTLTIHKVPKTKFTIGYLPKGKLPSEGLISELKRIGKAYNCIHILLEPNVIASETRQSLNKELKKSFHPLFTKFTFVLDITKPEDELLKSFHHKTRYNIKIAMKRKVKVVEDNSDESFKEYLKLTEETTTRQKFYAHTPTYHTKMWETLSTSNVKDQISNILTAHLLKATYQPPNAKRQTLATWILFVFHDTLYYPYGASSSMYRNVMASNLIMWEAIRFGKKLGLKYFDMWGALGENPDPKDTWFGFHKFKEGYDATHTEFIGSYDLVINPAMYQLYKLADKVRWIFLKLMKN